MLTRKDLAQILFGSEKDSTTSKFYNFLDDAEKRLACKHCNSVNFERPDDSTSLYLGRDSTIDAEQFESRALDSLDGGGLLTIPRALALYKGPYMPGLEFIEEELSTRQNKPAEVRAQRDYYADLHRQLLVRYSESFAEAKAIERESSQGKWVISVLRDALAARATDQKLVAALMRILVANARIEAARKVFSAFDAAYNQGVEVADLDPELCAIAERAGVPNIGRILNDAQRS